MKMNENLTDMDIIAFIYINRTFHITIQIGPLSCFKDRTIVFHRKHLTLHSFKINNTNNIQPGTYKENIWSISYKDILLDLLLRLLITSAPRHLESG